MSGETIGAVRLTLRIEGLCLLIAALLAYSQYGQGWGLFALFFLTPDLSFLGYLAGPRLGALCYNMAHSLIGALISLCLAALLSHPILLFIGIIWCAHIGFDRTLGYGLKYAKGFAFTHLGTLGRLSKAQYEQTIDESSLRQ